MPKELVDLSLQLHAETPKAVLVSDDGDDEKAIWLPKSQIEVNSRSPKGIVELTLPEWLARDRGLI